MLQLLILPYWGIPVRWPRVLQRCVQILGVMSFFGCTGGIGALLLELDKARSPWPGLVYYSVCIAITIFVMRRRKGVQPPAGALVPVTSNF